MLRKDIIIFPLNLLLLSSVLLPSSLSLTMRVPTTTAHISSQVLGLPQLLTSAVMVATPSSFSGTAPCPHDQVNWICTIILSLTQPSPIDRTWIASGGDGNIDFVPPTGTLNEYTPSQQVTVYIPLTVCTSYTLSFLYVNVLWNCEKAVPTPTPLPTARVIKTPTANPTTTAIKVPSPTPKPLLIPSPTHPSSGFGFTQEGERVISPVAKSDPQVSVAENNLGIYILLCLILIALIILCVLVGRNYTNKQRQ